MRSFIAIDCDKKLKENIAFFVKGLDKGTGNVRWTKNQGKHLTLKFLGEITDSQLESINRELKISINNFNSFDLIFRGTGSFPPSSNFPKVLWVGVEENEVLRSLQREIERSLFKLGFPKEKRNFFPHLTLGRVKKNQKLKPILTALHQSRDKFFGKMSVDKLTLFKSTLKPTGAEYSVLSEFKIQ